MLRLPLCFLLAMLACHPLSAATKPVRVAIIFDDGPIPGATEPLLEVLAKEKVCITFGTIAYKAREHPELTRAAAKAGHEIANHSWTHEHPVPLKDAQLEEQIVGAQKIFVETVGVKPVWYWPPYIEKDPRMDALAKKAGIAVYSFRKLVASLDYLPEQNAEQLRKNATTGIEDGTVILFHETRKESIEQLPAILSDLRAQGCVFLTFSQLAVALAK